MMPTFLRNKETLFNSNSFTCSAPADRGVFFTFLRLQQQHPLTSNSGSFGSPFNFQQKQPPFSSTAVELAPKRKNSSHTLLKVPLNVKKTSSVSVKILP